MKKFFCYILTMTLMVFNIPASAAATKPENDMLRVGIFFGATAKQECTIRSDSGFLIGTEENRIFSEQYIIEDNSITIKMSQDGIATFADKEFDCNDETRLTIMPAGNNFLSTYGNSYRGGIQILNAGNGKMSVINFIDADEYVYGVIGMEMSASWHIEALKAQAVCARNYALSSLNKHGTYGFDICTSTDCQVYSAVNAETESTIKAGKETEEKYLLYNGYLAETLFFSCSGGYTANAKYVWGNEVPYLKGVEDPYESPDDATRYNWSKTYTCDEIKQRLDSLDINIGDITDITTVCDEKSGYVYEITILGTNGSHTYKREKTRTWMGWDKLYSQRYTVTPILNKDSQLHAITSKGTKVINEYFAIGKDGQIEQAQFPPVIKSSKSTTSSQNDVYAFRFEGHGWGHGVGMSQYGAKAMAELGFDYKEILEFYYNGAYLE